MNCQGVCSTQSFAPSSRCQSHLQYVRLAGKCWKCFSENLYDVDGRPQSKVTPEQEDVVLQLVKETPELSTLALARELNVSSSTCAQTITNRGALTISLHNRASLPLDDFQRRIDFFDQLLQQHEAYNDFVAHILWKDEACFTHDGLLNSHRSHMWSESNPRATQLQSHQVRWYLNVWAGILLNRMTEPNLLSERLKGHSYLVFFRDVPTNFLDNM